ncbi:MAG: hypothetical protein M1814_004643 [Vezdaea aestivalis]|nr:MAG: hypothetical protein M1814_004643 [Vezdaea aestivalis]
MKSVSLSLIALAASVSAQDYYSGYTSASIPSLTTYATQYTGPATGASTGLSTAAVAGNSSVTSSAALGSATRTVQVGVSTTLRYNPDSLSAAVGDTIVFEFNPLNHSVVQSNFANPCIPLAQSQSGAVGFNSGFMPVPANSSLATKKTFSVRVVNTDPIWYYCAQVRHCQQGMVGVINPPANSSNNIAAFRALAASATTAVAPSSVVSSVYATKTDSAGATPSGYTAGGGLASGTAGTSSGSAGAASATSATSTGAAAPTGASRKDVYAGMAVAGVAALAMGL